MKLVEYLQSVVRPTGWLSITFSQPRKDKNPLQASWYEILIFHFIPGALPTILRLGELSS